MATESQVICAIKNISTFCDVKNNLRLFVKTIEASENGTINLDNLKNRFKDIYSATNSVFDIFYLILLEHDNIKTLYLIKGLELIISDKNPTEFTQFEIELIANLQRTIEDKDMMSVFVKIMREAGIYQRFISIRTQIQ